MNPDFALTPQWNVEFDSDEKNHPLRIVLIDPTRFQRDFPYKRHYWQALDLKS
jgi:hypothetical protein